MVKEKGGGEGKEFGTTIVEHIGVEGFSLMALDVYEDARCSNTT